MVTFRETHIVQKGEVVVDMEDHITQLALYLILHLHLKM